MLIFSLGNVISVELSVACNIYIALEKRKGHRVSIEGKSPYNEYHIVDSRRKIFPSNLMTFWATIYHA